jgi:hypothetical protein
MRSWQGMLNMRRLRVWLPPAVFARGTPAANVVVAAGNTADARPIWAPPAPRPWRL